MSFWVECHSRVTEYYSIGSESWMTLIYYFYIKCRFHKNEWFIHI